MSEEENEEKGELMDKYKALTQVEIQQLLLLASKVKNYYSYHQFILQHFKPSEF